MSDDVTPDDELDPYEEAELKRSGRAKPAASSASAPEADADPVDEPGDASEEPAANDDGATAPEPAPADAGGGGGLAAFVKSPAAPWVAVAVVVIVALIAIVGSGGDGGDDSSGSSNDTEAASDEGGSTATTEAKETCPKFSLGANLLGEPKVAAKPGVHIWHDINGFHLTVVPGDGVPEQVSGTVTPTGTALALVEPAAPAASEQDGVITFELGGENDELLFKASCSTSAVSFDLTSGGQALTPDQVTVGPGNVPPAVPVVLTRTPS